jgi:hypothetical protein
LIHIAPPRHACRRGSDGAVQATVRQMTDAARLCASFGPPMDTRTKLVIAALFVLVLVFVVIGGLIAIASPPNSCC